MLMDVAPQKPISLGQRDGEVDGVLASHEADLGLISSTTMVSLRYDPITRCDP